MGDQSVGVESTPVIGLQRLDPESRVGISTIFGIHAGLFLGRYDAEDNKPNHIDLGMNMENAKQVSSKSCFVESVTPNCINLRLHQKLFRTTKQLYKPQIERLRPGNSSKAPPLIEQIKTQRVTINLGDILIFITGQAYPDHYYKVVMPTTTRAQSKASERAHRSGSSFSSSNTTAVSSTTTFATATSPTGRKRTARKTVAESQSKIARRQASERTPKKKRHYHGLAKGETPFAAPWSRTAPIASNGVDQSFIAENQSRSDPTAEQASSTHLSATNNPTAQDDDEDMDDEASVEDETDPATRSARDMHTTLCNTLQSALLSSTTPSMGANLLQLATIGQYPSFALCQALLQSLILPLECRDEMESTADLVRRHFVLEYLQGFWEEHTTLALDRLGVAMGADGGWRDILLNLTHTVDTRAREILSMQHELQGVGLSTLSALESHCLALQVLQFLLRAKSPTLVSLLQEFGAAAACRLAATTFSQVYRHFEDLMFQDSILTVTLRNLVDCLGCIVRDMVLYVLLASPRDKDETSPPDKKLLAEATTLLRNSLFAYQEGSIKPSVRVCVGWLQCLSWTTTQSDLEAARDLEASLAKRLGIENAYHSK